VSTPDVDPRVRRRAPQQRRGAAGDPVWIRPHAPAVERTSPLPYRQFAAVRPACVIPRVRSAASGTYDHATCVRSRMHALGSPTSLDRTGTAHAPARVPHVLYPTRSSRPTQGRSRMAWSAAYARTSAAVPRDAPLVRTNVARRDRCPRSIDTTPTLGTALTESQPPPMSALDHVRAGSRQGPRLGRDTPPKAAGEARRVERPTSAPSLCVQRPAAHTRPWPPLPSAHAGPPNRSGTNSQRTVPTSQPTPFSRRLRRPLPTVDPASWKDGPGCAATSGRAFHATPCIGSIDTSWAAPRSPSPAEEAGDQRDGTEPHDIPSPGSAHAAPPRRPRRPGQLNQHAPAHRHPQRDHADAAGRSRRHPHGRSRPTSWASGCQHLESRR
jgi:hypothetical protein